MAQLVEQRIRNAWVRGSSPLIGFSKPGKIKASEILPGLIVIKRVIRTDFNGRAVKDKSTVSRFIFLLRKVTAWRCKKISWIGK